MTEKNNLVDGRLALAKDLVTALEMGDEQTAERLLGEISRVSESQLFQDVGRLTRELHDTLSTFASDTKFAEMARKDIPDAKERLNYVITMTEQAANQTMDVVERLLPVSDEMNAQANRLAENWQRFLVRKMPFEEFRSMSQELTDYFQYSVGSLETIQHGLNEVLMAQGFQDITGQIIRRVIDLVHNLENSMVELIRISGGIAAREEPAKTPDLPGPVVPGVDDQEGDTASSQDEVDDLLSSLGF